MNIAIILHAVVGKLKNDILFQHFRKLRTNELIPLYA